MGPKIPREASSSPLVPAETIAKYRPLIKNRARMFHRGWLARIATVEDLESIAAEAVWRATLAHSESRGAKFGTYVIHVVNHALGNVAKGARRAKRRGLTVSTTEGDDGELPVILVSESPTDSRISAMEVRTAVREAVDRLVPRLRDVVESRYWRDETLQAIGERHGVSRERIRQLEAEALDELRPRLRAVWAGGQIGDAA